MNENKKTNQEYIGVVKVGEKGQIVIPKKIRDGLNIQKGDSLIFTSGEKDGMKVYQYNTRV